MHLVKGKQLGLPQNTREAFELLEKAAFISTPVAQSMQAMVGFINIAVHQYQDLNLDILRVILESHLDDFSRLINSILKR